MSLSARRSLYSLFVVVVGVLAFATAPALAAPLEAPELTVESVTATTATLHGVLNPNAESGAGTYEFIYKQGKAGCTGGTKAPVPAGMMSGAEREEPYEGISGLTQGTEYTVCLRAVNTTSAPVEEATSPAVTFTTAIPPETPLTSSPAQAITATTVTFEGTLNPKKAGNAGSYEFLYRISATECEGESATASEPALGKAGEKVEAKVTSATPLQPRATYTFCLLARNSAGETAVGAPVHFTTLPSAPSVATGGVSAVKAGEARLEATVNPNNQTSECKFEYEAEEPSLAAPTTALCEPSSFPAEYGGQGAALNVGGLEADKTYYYRVLASNEQSNKEGKPAEGSIRHFTTAFPPETPEVKPASPLAIGEATLHGVLNPASDHESEPGSDEFLYRQSSTECQGENERKLTPRTSPKGQQGETTEATAMGLSAGTTYTFCLLIRNNAGETALSGPETFTTKTAAPTVEEEYVSDVSASGATLHATVDPWGAETSYVFEYARTGQAFKPAAETDATGSTGASAVGVPVEVHVQQGIEASTEYEFRVVASNTVQSGVAGEAVAFTTQQNGKTFSLLDNRQYEMVSPPEKYGALIEGIAAGEGVVDAATNGDAITYVSHVPTEAEPLGFNHSVQNLSTRTAAGSWQTRDLTVPHGTPVGSQESSDSEYRFFSADLSHSIVHPIGFFTPCQTAQGVSQPCMSPEASEQTSFLTTNFFNGNVAEQCLPQHMHCAQPLVSACPKAGEPCPRIVEEHADAPAGTVFGGLEGGDSEYELKHCLQQNGNKCGPEFVAATPDMSHVLIKATASLTGEAPPSSESETLYLYEWSAGRLTYVGEGHAPSEADSISADGSRVIFVGSSEGQSGLLMRDTTAREGRGETVEIGVPGYGSEFEGASSDDSRVFFSGGPNGGLYVYEVNKPISERVTSLTGSAALAQYGNGPGDVLGVSADGSYVYFVSGGALAPGAEPGNCEYSAGINPGDKCNLYVDHYTGSEWKPAFIATLADGNKYDTGDGFDFLGRDTQPVRVSPNGQWLAFMSEASLTGYDNIDVNETPTGSEISQGVGLRVKVKHPTAEVYLYHAATAESAATLTCASCEPTGTRPAGVEYASLGLAGLDSPGLFDSWPDGGFVAAYLPGSQDIDGGENYKSEDYQSRYLSNNGRLFFNSLDPLVPDDVDGVQDVYEYEPEGVGDCAATASSGAVVFEPSRGGQGAGCVGLISSGTSSSPSAFLDASESAGDVFFLTTSKLSGQDKDSAYDVYDAHECSASSPCASAQVSAPPCETEASCRTSPTPQPSVYGLPSSATFSGPGNVVVGESTAPPPKKVVKKAVKCKKNYVKNKRGKCVKRAVKKHRKSGKSTQGAKR